MFANEKLLFFVTFWIKTGGHQKTKTKALTAATKTFLWTFFFAWTWACVPNEIYNGIMEKRIIGVYFFFLWPTRMFLEYKKKNFGQHLSKQDRQLSSMDCKYKSTFLLFYWLLRWPIAVTGNPGIHEIICEKQKFGVENWKPLWLDVPVGSVRNITASESNEPIKTLVISFVYILQNSTTFGAKKSFQASQLIAQTTVLCHCRWMYKFSCVFRTYKELFINIALAFCFLYFTFLYI